MADNSSFPPDADPSGESGGSVERSATPSQWAAMTFEPVVIDASKFGTNWEQARGAVARIAVALLGFDDRDLTQYFLNQSEPLQQAMQVHAGLEHEIDYLKTHLEALEMVATRVLCAASRCAESSSS